MISGQDKQRDRDWDEVQQDLTGSFGDGGGGKLYRREAEPLPEPEPNDSEWVLWYRFLRDILRVGGWAAAMLLAFRFVLIPLVSAANSPVTIILAIAVSGFLLMAGFSAFFCNRFK